MSAETSTRAHEAARHLSSADPVMAGIVQTVGVLDQPVEADLWRAIVGSIVGQQLSVAAARTIRNRVAALGSNEFPTPAEILAFDDERLRGCGLSRAKVLSVRDLARRWSAGELEPGEIARLEDEAVIERLVQVRGIGRWTAEMVLIFSLGRPDVLSVGDLGIRVAAQKAYGLDDRPDGPTLEKIAAAWSPYRSFACLYLWRSLSNG